MALPLFLKRTLVGLVAAVLLACATPPSPPADGGALPAAVPPPATPKALPDTVASSPALLRGNSRWQPVAWSELPGFENATLW